MLCLLGLMQVQGVEHISGRRRGDHKWRHMLTTVSSFVTSTGQLTQTAASCL